MCWLVEERPDIETAFLEAIAAGEFEHVPVTAADLARMAELVRAYADLPLADPLAGSSPTTGRQIS